LLQVLEGASVIIDHCMQLLQLWFNQRFTCHIKESVVDIDIRTGYPS
jgi:hypothetical protein